MCIRRESPNHSFRPGHILWPQGKWQRMVYIHTAKLSPFPRNCLLETGLGLYSSSELRPGDHNAGWTEPMPKWVLKVKLQRPLHASTWAQAWSLFHLLVYILSVGWGGGSKSSRERKKLFTVKHNFSPRTNRYKLTMNILVFKLKDGFQSWGESNSKATFPQKSKNRNVNSAEDILLLLPMFQSLLQS